MVNSELARRLARMLESPIRSIEGVCEVGVHRGRSAALDSVPDLLIETPHGATYERHFDALEARLEGPFPAGLKDFFFVNTDVGSAELGARIAERAIAADPRRTVLTVSSLIPRTFVDCNRIIDGSEQPTDGVTPGLAPYIRSSADRARLVDLHAAYTQVVSAALAQVCSPGGNALLLHTYAPRTVDVQVDDDIVQSLRWAYTPEVVSTWPLRHEVDLITADADGRVLADPQLLARVRAAFLQLGITPAENATYYLHPATSAAVYAARYPGQTLCLEVRRDLLVPEFTPFAEMAVDPDRVDRFAQVLASALLPR